MRRPVTRALGVVALLAACTPAPTILPTNDFNRPTDIAFMCLGAFGQPGTDADGNPIETAPFTVSGRPMSVCHPPTEANSTDRAAQPKASIKNRTFAFVPSSASGDLSVIDADIWKLVDLNKATGGYGRVPLGTLPEQISTTTDGCRLMSANRGSCDLSLVDPSTLLAPVFAAQFNSATTGVDVSIPFGNGIQRIDPRRGDGTLLAAAPYEAVFLPQDTSQINNCPIEGAAPATPWRALVTFPSCDLVAIVDLPSGNIVASSKVTLSNGNVVLVDAGTSPACRADCGSDRDTGASDAGAPDAVPPDPDGGGTDAAAPVVPPGATAAAYRPTGIAIAPQATHAWVSLSNHPAILSFGLTPSAITAPQQTVELHQAAQGSNRIRLGVDPWGVRTVGQPFPGRFVGDNASRAYLYVIARDGSLRIIDVFVPGDEQECETNFDALNPQVDPQNPIQVDASVRCIPYGSVNRRPYSSETAGLRFPTFPIDVAAADMGRAGDQREDTVNGAYAWVLTANGIIYLINIDPVQRTIKAVVHRPDDRPDGDSPQGQTVLFDPDPASVATYQDNGFIYKNEPTVAGGGVKEPPPFPNRPRDRNFLSYSASLDPTLGLVRLDIPPIAATGPYIEPIYTQGTEDNATVTEANGKQTHVFFPDRDGAVAQGWDVIWQGTIVSPRYSGVLRGNVLRDGGGGFCSAGVQLGDIVTLNGCTSTPQCPLGMVCQRDTTLDQVGGGYTVTGLCVSANLQGGLESRCAPYVSSLRKYEIVEARNSQLTLAPHLDEVVRSSLTPCQPPGPKLPDPDCPEGMGGGAGMGGAGGTGGAAGVAGTGGGGMGGAGGTAGSGGATCWLDEDHADCHDLFDGSTSAFKCVELGGQRRCLDPCTRQQDCRQGRVCLRSCQVNADCPSNECAPDGMCRTGRACPMGCGDCQKGESCVDGQCEVNSYCADGPPLGQDGCFPQLTGYQVNANAGFTVTGSSSGSFSFGVDEEVEKNGEKIRVCAPDPNRDPRLVSRIPLRPPPDKPSSSIICDTTTNPKTPPAPTFPTLTKDMTMPAADGFFIDRFDPRIAPVIDTAGRAGPLKAGVHTVKQEATQLAEWMKTWTADVAAPNACIYMAGPIASDPANTADPTGRHCRPQHVRARFRNTQIAFVLANIDRAPPTANPLHFEVHGGFRPQFVAMPNTVEISAPARLVLGPVDSNQEAKVTPGPAPYFFVVDQRRLGRGQGGGPTRGQIVRVNPFGLAANGYLPIYEDYSRSGNLFPIQ